MNGSDSESHADSDTIDDIPESLRYLCAKQLSNPNKALKKASKDLVAFFTTLGRSYISSKIDSSSIDIQ